MVRDSPLLMSEEYSIANSKQTDFGFGVDAQAEVPLRPDLPLPVKPLPQDVCHGRDSLCWLLTSLLIIKHTTCLRAIQLNFN